MNFVPVIQSQGIYFAILQFSDFIVVIFSFTKYRSSHSINIVNEIVEFISKSEFLEVSILTFRAILAQLIILLVKTYLKYWQNLTILQVQKLMPVR